MSASDWSTILGRSQFLGELYSGAPPTPEQCELFYVHIDERDNSATIGFVTSNLPANPRPEWRERPYNRLEFYLYFCDLTGLLVEGWSASEAQNFDISAVSEEGIAIRVGREKAGISFRASSLRLVDTRVFLATEGL
ncbi:Imm50 family immunity protein [Streptomyces sp. NPDC006527]|uniref:Imm50 family immunity protein n=1 Tax=Streptomyces sp. NPDC006527 TaxID=3364749 RepID=UPI0036C5CD3C